MNQAELETFLSVVENQSFSEAATNLHLTQPAVSKRIAQLEARLNTRLFDRLGRQVVLTGAGRLLEPNARRILQEIAETERQLSNLQEHIAGSLQATTSHHIGLHRLAPALRQFNRDHQDVRLQLRFEDSEAGYALVRQGHSELAVVTLNPQGDQELRAERLWTDPLVFCVARDHPLTKPGRLQLSMLTHYPAVLPGPETYTGRILVTWFQEAGLILPDGLTTNYLETIKMLVASGLGWSLLPAAMIDEQLYTLPLNTRTLTRTLGIVTHPRRTQSNAARAFIDILHQYADQEGIPANAPSR